MIDMINWLAQNGQWRKSRLPQNMCFENKINFIIDVPDEVLDYEIVKLVLQLIFGNSIQHRIFEKELREGDVVITAWM